MITFILLAFFCMFAIALAGVAYSANQRRRSGVAGMPSIEAYRSAHGRATGRN